MTEMLENIKAFARPQGYDNTLMFSLKIAELKNVAVYTENCGSPRTTEHLLAL